jgi:mannose-6-phosphate isomerase-like protein (cupin superfamily)
MSTDTIPKMTLSVATKANPNYVKGRRDFFKYQELGVTAATHGRMRAQITSAENGMAKPTGWHYHQCEMQLVYMVKGWLDLEFEDRVVRLHAGDTMMIPGGEKHNEIATSDSFELLEVSVPAQMDTVACEAPVKRAKASA